MIKWSVDSGQSTVVSGQWIVDRKKTNERGEKLQMRVVNLSK